jgi:hypothetical protein
MRSAVCRYCRQPVAEGEGVPTTSYWGAVKDVCHPACKRDGERAEALECQTIDADCNDCRHFRAYRRDEPGYAVTKHARTGWCEHHDRETTAFPVFCSGHPCFVHRRSG